MKYKDVEKISYFELEKEKVYRGKSPISVHFPLNMPFSDTLLYTDCAFNIFSLPVAPDMKSGVPHCNKIRQEMKIQMASFLFDEVAFIPDFRQTVWKRPEGGYPIASGSFVAKNLEYDLTTLLDTRTRLVYTKVSVTNHADTAKTAVIRVFQSRTQENAFRDYHYIPFRWDAEKWSHLVKDETIPLVIDAGKYEVTENDSFSYDESMYPKFSSCACPYTAAPTMRIREMEGFTKFAAELAPDEKASFVIATAFDGSRKEMAADDFDTVWSRSRKYWDSLLKDGILFYGNKKESDIFRALQWCSLQMLLELESAEMGKICQPCQGGSSERYYVWVWEAMCSLRPMLKLGYFEEVKKVIAFIFQLQDGGCPPIGEFKSLEGAIGTTGPRWANATGAALVLSSEYAEFSKDQEFIKEYLPKMLRAARWILREVKATRKYKEDGSKIKGFGVMPLCCATDGDHGYILASTDLWSLAGVESFARLLKALKDPDYEEIAKEVRQYRNDLSNAIDSVTLENGFIDRKLSDEGTIDRAFSVSAGAVKYLNTFGDPREERFRKFIHYAEENLFNDRFCGPLFDRINYIGNSESNLFTAYLKLNEWKKAHLAFSTFRYCGMTQDLYLTQERFSEVDDCFIPWQPNASNNGRYLQMVIDSLYLQRGEKEYILFGGVSPLSLIKNERFSLERLYTPGGKVSLELEKGRLTVTRSKEFAPGTIFQLPEYISFQCENGSLKALENNRFQVITRANTLTGKVEAVQSKLF